ncbi:hypothetical protein [Helicobacter sp. 11S02629-2]|uniref:hypothetical protein n=1 Tax=Helicobacter sp. 11S02629-2 TaxID=1476195 RepID=UPI000BA6C3FB|nr:hypothetical protein [Helicobacter sp. 11S02629-2]PAF42414.1 hypothetical protein BKH40_07860 [Helicobacter sp. 11S02629-2]
MNSSNSVAAGAIGTSLVAGGATIAGIDSNLSAALNNQQTAIASLQKIVDQISTSTVQNVQQANNIWQQVFWNLNEINASDGNPTTIITKALARRDTVNDLTIPNETIRPDLTTGTTGQDYTAVSAAKPDMQDLNTHLNSLIFNTNQSQTKQSLTDITNQVQNMIAAVENAQKFSPTEQALYASQLQAQSTALAELQKSLAAFTTAAQKNQTDFATLSQNANYDGWTSIPDVNNNTVIADPSTYLPKLKKDAPSVYSAAKTMSSNAEAVEKALNDGDPATGVKSLKQAVADVAKATQDVAVIRAAVAASNASAQASLNAATKDAAAKRNNAVTILPTAKAGIVAFFGKHQSVSVEYQYYFRNTNPNFTSGEVTLNYAYYFGGK